MGDVIDQIRANLETRAEQNGIEYLGKWISWGEVARFGDQVAALVDQAGCAPGGRIGVIIRNRAANAAAVIGLLAHRKSISFIYPFLPKAQMAEAIASLGAAAIVADEIDWPTIREAVAEVGSAGISLKGDASEPPRLVDGLETSRRPAPATPDDGSVEVLSSGTTGAPKRIAMPLSILERAVLSAPGGESGEVLPVMINVWPLGGVGGMCLLAASAAQGSPHVLIERFSVEALVDAIKRHRPDSIGLPPTAISMILDAKVSADDMASVKVVSGGSAYLDPDVQERFEKAYDAVILWGMGATEFCGTIVRWTPQLRQQFGNSKRGSTGTAMPGVELRAVDPESGELVSAGAEGLLEVYCPAVRPDWVRTTDVVAIDEDGFVFHRGRHDGAIVRGGFKILPERLVDALRAHPAVADASVIGLPDARLGAVPVAAVELVPGAPAVTSAELIDFLRDRLAPTHIPAELRIVDALPRTPSLKVSLTEVKRMFEKEAA